MGSQDQHQTRELSTEEAQRTCLNLIEYLAKREAYAALAAIADRCNELSKPEGIEISVGYGDGPQYVIAP